MMLLHPSNPAFAKLVGMLVVFAQMFSTKPKQDAMDASDRSGAPVADAEGEAVVMDMDVVVCVSTVVEAGRVLSRVVLESKAVLDTTVLIETEIVVDVDVVVDASMVIPVFSLIIMVAVSTPVTKIVLPNTAPS